MPNGRRPNSLRLPNYDYTRRAGYCVTIVTQNRLPLFTYPDSTIPNDAGRMIERLWLDLASRFRVILDVFVVMPDHLHGIILLSDVTGAALTEIIGGFKSLSTVSYARGVRSDGWTPFEGRLWQRNYFEHVIRNEQSLGELREYIASNPMAWLVEKQRAATRAAPT